MWKMIKKLLKTAWDNYVETCSYMYRQYSEQIVILVIVVITTMITEQMSQN